MHTVCVFINDFFLHTCKVRLLSALNQWIGHCIFTGSIEYIGLLAWPLHEELIKLQRLHTWWTVSIFCEEIMVENIRKQCNFDSILKSPLGLFQKNYVTLQYLDGKFMLFPSLTYGPHSCWFFWQFTRCQFSTLSHHCSEAKQFGSFMINPTVALLVQPM